MLFPTPPLPLETATIRFTPERRVLITLTLGSIKTYLTPLRLSSQTPRPLAISKSGLPHLGHLTKVCAASGTKWIASAVAWSSSSFLNRQVVPQTRHLSSVLAFRIRNFEFLNKLDFISPKAKRRISFSTS